MRKFFIVLIATMALYSTIAIAQETWKPPTPRGELKFRNGKVSLNRQGYYYTITAVTDFTLEIEVMSIFLGNGRDEALKAINHLIQISELPELNSYPYEKATFLVRDKFLEITEIKDKAYWGKAIILDKELEKMKSFIEQGK